MKKVAKDEARKTGNFGELRELRKIERKSFNKRKPKKTEPIINYQPITPPLIFEILEPGLLISNERKTCITGDVLSSCSGVLISFSIE